MRTTLIVLMALLLAVPVAAYAGGDQNQRQLGKEDGTPGNGDQVKDRERPDDPLGDCPNEPDCPGCPDCAGDGECDEACTISLATRQRDRDRDCDGEKDPDQDRKRDRDRDGDCDGPCGDCDGPCDDPPCGDCDGDGPNGPGGCAE
jgi:hypothetical protein